MAQSTPNLNLTLPVGGEHVSRTVFNNNMTAIDTAVGNLNAHFGNIGSGTNPCTSLTDIPLNFVGNVVMAAAISPNNNLRSYTCFKFGLSDIRHSIVVIDQYSSEMYINTMYNSYQGWKKVTTTSV